MFPLPDIPYAQIEILLAGTFVLVLGAIHLWRVLKSEIRPRKCVLCDESAPADEYAHHLEICVLRQKVAELRDQVTNLTKLLHAMSAASAVQGKSAQDTRLTRQTTIAGTRLKRET